MFAANQYALYPESEYRFTHFRKTHGYANQPLDGIWARAPYLHNGSVPTLRDLLNAPSERPKAFYRGYDVFDRSGSVSCRTCREEKGRTVLSVRHVGSRQRQRRPRIRHDASRGRQAGDRRVSEDVLIMAADRWFSRVSSGCGIVCNLALAVPTLVAPEQTMALTRMPPASPLLWPQFAALLLILLSVFYMPAAIDFARYRITAWSAVGSRLAGVIFFVGFQPREYRMLGYFDLVFFVPEAVLLTLAFSALDAHDRADAAERARAIEPL